MKLTFDSCQAMKTAVMRVAKEHKLAVSFAVADQNGLLYYFTRHPKAIIPSVELSQRKAFTAAAVRMGTLEFGKIAQPGQSAYGIHVAYPGLIVFAGGLPLWDGDDVIGGVGVSGATAEEDDMLANIAVVAFQDYIATV